MNSSDKEFVGIVDDIKSAEKKSQDIKDNAEKEAQAILRSAKEDAAKIDSEIEDKVVNKKNKLLEEGSAKIESKVSAILNEGEQEASKIINKSLKQNKMDVLLKHIIE